MRRPPQAEPIHVRKYPNRRYYDTTNSRHVTLADLYGIVQDGGTIVVTDSTTGTDITSAVLTQILLEFAGERLALFPAKLLHQALQANQQMVGRFIQEYFAKAIDAFSQSRRQFDEFLMKAGLSPLTASTPLDWAQMFFREFTGAQPPSAAATDRPADAGRTDETVAALKRRVEELSAEMEQLRTRKPTAGASRAGKRTAQTRRPKRPAASARSASGGKDQRRPRRT